MNSWPQSRQVRVLSAKDTQVSSRICLCASRIGASLYVRMTCTRPTTFRALVRQRRFALRSLLSVCPDRLVQADQLGGRRLTGYGPVPSVFSDGVRAPPDHPSGPDPGARFAFGRLSRTGPPHQGTAGLPETGGLSIRGTFGTKGSDMATQLAAGERERL